MKTIAFLFVLWTSVFSISNAQSIDRHWWDSHGVKAQWYSQDDVFAFKTFNDVRIVYPNLPGVISVAQEKNWDGLHICRFHPGLPQSIRDAAINTLKNNPDFECVYDAVTPFPNREQVDDKWRVINQHLLVTFYDPGLSQAAVDSFMTRWSLALVSGPPSILPAEARWPYIFENKHIDRCDDRKTIDIVRDIMIEDSALVEFAEPNIMNLMVPYSNDPLFGKMWHAQNTGQVVSHGLSGLVDADCDIVEAWNKGFTGAGINIAVIDFDGFDTLHEDMVGAYIPTGYNSIDTSIDVFDVIMDSLPASHGNSIAGIIAANKDNQKGAAGVVPDARVGAFLTKGYPDQVVECFRRIILDQNYPYSIANMSFGAYDTTLNGFNSLKVLTHTIATSGRNGLGLVLIAAAGNAGVTPIPYPASLPEIISVGGTTPTDSIKIKFDRWDTIGPGFSGPWGSNYGLGVDFAAPGFGIPALDLRDSLGVSPSDYRFVSGTSVAAPIAAGIAAMILQANPNLPFRGAGSVYDFMKMGAERVGGYNYYAYWPNPQDTGRSAELGYGRLNACNSLNLVALEEEKEAFRASFKIANLSNGEVKVYYDIRHLGGDFDLELIDLNGRVLKIIDIPRGKFWMRVPTELLPAGMYFARLHGNRNGFSDTEKFFIFK